MAGNHPVASSLPVSSWLFILKGCQQPQCDKGFETTGKALRRTGLFSTLHHWSPTRCYAASSAAPLCPFRQNLGSGDGGIGWWVNCSSVPRKTLWMFSPHWNALNCVKMQKPSLGFLYYRCDKPI